MAKNDSARDPPVAKARTAPGLPENSAEKATILVHYYRGEMGRMTSWRDRIDRTSNWAITVVAGLLSVSLSAPNSHHGVVLFAMLLVSLFLLIEARRYRFFDVYRARVRQLECNYFAPAFTAASEIGPDWAAPIAASLRQPQFLISWPEAVSRRIRRNYGWMYLILLLAWALKISTPTPAAVGSAADTVWSLGEIIDNAALGPMPGWMVCVVVGLFHCAVLFAAIRLGPSDGELTKGGVHV